MSIFPNHRPVIGVTGEDRRLPVSWWFIRSALRRVGAQAIHLTPAHREIPTHLDGLIISGGDDIDQGLYLPDAPEIAPINPRRDRFEIAVLERFLPRSLPILGICRGAQLLNVVLGGSLHVDLSHLRRRTSNRRMLLPRKTLLLEAGSHMQEVLGTERCRINSLHHQAIDRLGEGMVVSGRDLDGITQAVEAADGHFRIGVQWHPEYLPFQRPQRRLFKTLCEAASQ